MKGQPLNARCGRCRSSLKDGSKGYKLTFVGPYKSAPTVRQPVRVLVEVKCEDCKHIFWSSHPDLVAKVPRFTDAQVRNVKVRFRQKFPAAKSMTDWEAHMALSGLKEFDPTDFKKLKETVPQ